MTNEYFGRRNPFITNLATGGPFNTTGRVDDLRSGTVARNGPYPAVSAGPAPLPLHITQGVSRETLARKLLTPDDSFTQAQKDAFARWQSAQFAAHPSPSGSGADAIRRHAETYWSVGAFMATDVFKTLTRPAIASDSFVDR
jgi:hypothetical protein